MEGFSVVTLDDVVEDIDIFVDNWELSGNNKRKSCQDER